MPYVWKIDKLQCGRNPLIKEPKTQEKEECEDFITSSEEITIAVKLSCIIVYLLE